MPTDTTSPSTSDSDHLVALVVCLAAVVAIYLATLWLCFGVLAWWYHLHSSEFWLYFWGTGSWWDRLQRPLNASWRLRYWAPQIWWGVIAAAILDAATVGLIGWLYARTRPPRRQRDLRRRDAARSLTSRSCKPAAGIYAGRYGGRRLYVPDECRGIVVGPPGTGKSTFLMNQLLKLSTRRVSFVCADTKPEIHQALAPDLADAGYRVLRLNPARGKTDHYNPLDDLTDDSAVTELAANLLPCADPKDRPYIDAKRDYLRGALLHLKATASGIALPAVYDFLYQSSNPKQIVSALAASPNHQAATIGQRLALGLANGKDPLTNIGAVSVGRDIEWLNLPGVKSCLAYSDFRAGDLGHPERPVALFLEFPESRQKTLGPLQSALYGHFLRILIDNVGTRGPVALFLDEIGNLPPIEGLLQKLNTVRSRRLPVWTYWQSLAQMERQYGRDAQQIISGAANVQLYFRAQDVTTQQQVSTLAGTTSELHTSRSTSTSHHTRTEDERTVNVIEPHQVGELRHGEVIAFYDGAKAIGVATPHYRDYPRHRSG